MFMNYYFIKELPFFAYYKNLSNQFLSFILAENILDDTCLIECLGYESFYKTTEIYIFYKSSGHLFAFIIFYIMFNDVRATLKLESLANTGSCFNSCIGRDGGSGLSKFCNDYIL